MLQPYLVVSLTFSMKITVALLTILVSQWALGQISGTVKGGESENPIPFVNVWVKNTPIGATTGKEGKFLIEKAEIGDSIHVSSLGYKTVELPARRENNIVLRPKINMLDEVVVIPMKNSSEYLIESFKKIKKNRPWYNNGHYSLARFYRYKREYEKTPFINRISLITNNAKKENVVFKIRLVKVAPNGEPSESGLIENRIMESEKRVNEVSVDLKQEKVVFPKNGFFVVVDRLNLEENKSYNRISKSDILQPAIGMERTEQEKNTWFGFGGKWIPPSEMKEFLGTNGNIAVNVKLTN